MAEKEHDLRFGKMAVDRGFITSSQLERASKEQSTKDEQPSLAQLLVDMGFITPSQAETITRFVEAEHEDLGDAAAGSDLVGTILGGCRLLEVIGSGGMGTMYRAHHTRLDREVAVKTLHARLLRVGGMAERFQREAQAAAKLSHPNIVSVFDFDRKGPLYFMIMQYVQGVDLKEIIESSGPLNLPQAIWVMAQVLQGLAEAHKLGIVHRDIKPANILFHEGASQVYITDFGTVRLLSSSTSETLSTYGEILGTPQYMAPEQAMADDVDGRTDLYAVGMTFYELLEGRPPFTGNSVVEVLEKHILEPTPPLSGEKALVNDIIAKLTAKQRDDRYASALEAAAALKAIYPQAWQNAQLSSRRDPSRSSGPTIPTVDMSSLEAIASHLQQSQQMGLMAFEDDEDSMGVGATYDGAGTDISIPVVPMVQEPELEDTPKDKKFGTEDILNSALNGDLSKVIPEIVADGRAKELVPDLMLLLWQNDKLDTILQLSGQLERAAPTLPAIPFFVGLSHAKREDFEKARSSFNVAVALDSSHVPAQIHLASSLVKLERLNEAQETLRRCSLLNPNSLVAAVRYAEFLSGVVEQWEDAVDAYEKAISLDPERLELRRKLGLILVKLDRLDEAEAVASEIAEWSGKDDEASELLDKILKRRTAQLLSRSDRLEPIKVESLPFEEASSEKGRKPKTSGRLKQVPPKLKPRLELLRLAVAGRNFTRAEDVYKQGLEELGADPCVSQFHIAFGQVALKLGKPEEAKGAFERALDMKPDSKKAHKGMQKALLLLANKQN